MGLARSFNNLVHRELVAHAAWLPVTNTFKLGDYGLIRGGVFQRLGNISEFGVDELDIADGPVSTIDFTSEGVTKTSLSGEAEIDLIEENTADARIRISFENKDSFVVRAALSSREVVNKAEVARKVFRDKNWSRSYKLVTTVFEGQDPVIIASTEAGAEIELGGKASALQAFSLGGVEAGLEIKKSRKIGLNVVGEQGIVGIRMIRRSWFGTRPVLATGKSLLLESSVADPDTIKPTDELLFEEVSPNSGILHDD